MEANEQDLQKNLKTILKKHLLGVFLCAAVYDVDATLKYLNQ